MYFVVIMAFALVLSDRLPVAGGSILPGAPALHQWAALGIVLAQIPLLALISGIGAVRTQYRLDGTDAGHDEAADELSWFQQFEMVVVSAFLLFTMVSTPWPQVVREVWGLGRIPLVAELVMLAPMGLGLLAAWTMQYPAELRLRVESLETPGDVTGNPEAAGNRETEAAAALRAARRTPDPARTGLGAFLLRLESTFPYQQVGWLKLCED